MISLLLPTRGRPQQARRFLDSVADRASNLDEIEVIVYVDHDDQASHAIDHPRVRLHLIVGRDGTMGEFNSRCLAASSGSIVVLTNDDIVIRSDGWDQALRDLDRRFPDGIYMAYPNDLFKGRRVATFPILPRRVCDLLEHPYPVAYRGALIDYHLLDVFKRLQQLGHDRVCYLEDLIFEHMHHRTGKSECDDTYQRRSRFGDDGVFVALRGARQSAASRLAASIEGRPLPALAPAQPAERSKHWLPATAGYARTFLADVDLPLGWRTFLFAWYCGRHLAAHGLRRKVADSAA